MIALEGSRGKNLLSATSLIDVAKRLHSDRIDRIVSGYRESRVSVTRTFLLSLMILWALFFRLGSDMLPETETLKTLIGKQLPGEAEAVLPWLLGFYVLSVAWMLSLKAGLIKQSEWVDAAGAAANLLGIGIMLKISWNLSIATITFLPLVCIVIGARFNRGVFFTAVVASILIVGFAAPPGYWANRPSFGAFALVLVVGLPLIVYRLLAALYEVSSSAVLARDTQNRFVAMMSHELRTPLNTVVNASSLIDTRHMSDAQRQLLKSLHSNAQALQHRVNQVLDVAAINGGRLRLETEPFRIHDVVQTVNEVCGPLAREKNIRLVFDVAADFPSVILSDPGRIEQLLSNLVTNAVKFTPANGSVDVTIDCKASDDPAGAILRCAVRDTGIGIPDSEKSRVFEAFRQVSQGRDRRHGGVGLGLYIVRNISDQMGGQISVEDNPSGGAIFKWQVPIGRAAAGELPLKHASVQEALADHKANMPSMHCLVIEDDASNRDIIGWILDAAGHRTTFAEDGPSGLNAIRSKEPFDVIFLDLHMPGMSGLRVLQELKEDSVSHPPVIVLSADSTAEAHAEVWQVDIHDFLTKPISTRKLLDTLATLNTRAAVQGTKLPTSTRNKSNLRQPTDGMSPLDEVRYLGGPEFVRKFLRSVREGLTKSVEALEAAIAQNNTQDALDRTHALKNEFANVGYSKGVEACSAMYEALRNGQDATIHIPSVREHASLVSRSLDDLQDQEHGTAKAQLYG